MKNYSFIYQTWWKYLTILILVYVLVAGFLVPIRPGVLSVDQMEITTSSPYSLSVQTYNTHFTDTDRSLTAFIKIGPELIHQCGQVIIDDRDKLTLHGVMDPLPAVLGEMADATLIIHDDVDGYLIFPSAFSVIQQGAIPSTGAESSLVWSADIGAYDQEWTFRFPFIGILYETIRNTFFHVAIWMAMFILLIVSLVYSIKYLRSQDLSDDAVAASFTHVAVILGVLGLITGSIWARSTWGAYWPDDPKTNMSAIAMMIYAAYSVLRASISGVDRRARISASYNIFAFIAMIPLVFILPRLMDGLHPGNGGNPALGGEDLDSTLRLVFYPAVIGYTLLGVWLSSLLFRLRRLHLLHTNESL